MILDSSLEDLSPKDSSPEDSSPEDSSPEDLSSGVHWHSSSLISEEDLHVLLSNSS